MHTAAEKIARLKASLDKAELKMPERQARIALGHTPADLALGGGLMRGNLHEVFAEDAGHEAAATGFAVGLAARAADKKHSLWIRQDFCALEFGVLAATGILELGLDPSHFFLVQLSDAESAVRATSDALTCSALGVVILEISGMPKILDLVTSRRLALAAAQSNVMALLLRVAAKPQASAAQTRWLVRSQSSQNNNENWGAPLFHAGLVRNRHGRTGRWVMEWDCDHGIFRESRYAAADSGALVSPPADGPLSAALAAAGRTAA